MARRSAGEEADARSGFGLRKVAERTSNSAEQRVILKGGRSLGFAEYGDPKGEPVPLLHRALSFVACHAAIKAHAPLQREEMARLIADLAVTKTPYFCPHGRPIVSRLSLRDIKRELGRTW